MRKKVKYPCKYPAIEEYRKLNSYTIRSISRALGVERGTYYNWQQKGNIPADKLIKLSELLSCSTDRLLGINGNMGAGE